MQIFFTLFFVIGINFSAFAADIFIQSELTNSKDNLKVDSVVYQIDHNQYPPRAKISLTQENENIAILVNPNAVSVAVLLAASKETCVVSLSPGCIDKEETKPDPFSKSKGTKLKVLPALAMSQKKYEGIVLAESLLKIPRTNVEYYVLSEKPWHLNLKSFDNSLKHYFVYGMKDGQRVFDAQWTELWEKSLNGQEEQLLKEFNDLLVMRRFVKMVMEKKVQDIEGLVAFMRFVGELRPYYSESIIHFDSAQTLEFYKWIENLDPKRVLPCEKILSIQSMK